MALVPALAMWFTVEEGLNDFGYIPNAARSHRDYLPDSICSATDCRNRWGEPQGGQYKYARCANSESPRMRYRIELHFQKTHQKPIGARRGLGLAFARGVLAEKLGFAINWAAFAEIQCSRGHKRFISFGELRSLCENGDAVWPGNGVREVDESVLTGAPDDWLLNRNPRKLHSWRPTQGFDLRLALETRPESTISLPLHVQMDASRGIVTINPNLFTLQNFYVHLPSVHINQK